MKKEGKKLCSFNLREQELILRERENQKEKEERKKRQIASFDLRESWK